MRYPLTAEDLARIDLVQKYIAKIAACQSVKNVLKIARSEAFTNAAKDGVGPHEMEFLLSLAGTKALPAAISRYEITRSGHLAKVRAADKALGVLKRETKLLFRAAGAQGLDRNLMKLAMRKNPQSIEQAAKKYLRLKSFLNVLEAGADAPAPTSTTVEEKEHAGE